MNKNKKNSNKIMKGCGVLLCALSILFSMFFINTVTYAKDISKTDNSQEYILTLFERNGDIEKIKASDIGLKNDNNQVKFDDKLLKETIDKLNCLTNKNQIESKNASLVYFNNSYVISKEVYGNKVNKDTLYTNIVNAIKNGSDSLDLDKTNCYESTPRFVANSPAVTMAKDILNKYIATNVTYNFGGLNQYLSSSTIKTWVGVDSDFNIIIDENKVNQYVNDLANTYTSLLGSGILVSGGSDGNNHSWQIDTTAETKALIENIKSGQTISKYPIYTQNSSASYFDNIGDTFVEVDKSKQHVWFYKDGYLVVDGDLVTGNESSGHGTPTGVYKLNFKQKDAVLVGEDYQSPVNFWMPFIANDIGLHDASWRDEFGGDIYKTNGSHGCVNLPYSVAETIYNNISAGCPVIVHE